MKDQIISPDGTMTDMPKAQGDDGVYTLKQMQDVVGGPIQALAAYDGRLLIVNDEALLKGLEHNPEASDLVGFPIMGMALICEREMFT